MRISLARLRPLHLAGLTLLYWAGLAAVKLGAAIALAWGVARLPEHHGTISASLTNTVLSLSIVREGVQVWTGSASLFTLAGWVVGPPLLLALTARWMRETGARAEAIGRPEPPASLPSPPPEWEVPPRDAIRSARLRRPGDDLR